MLGNCAAAGACLRYRLIGTAIGINDQVDNRMLHVEFAQAEVPPKQADDLYSYARMIGVSRLRTV